MAHGFLFIPRKNHGQGKIIHPALKGIGQSHRNLNRGIGVIALANIQKPRNPADISQFFVKEPEFAAGKGQHHAILRHFFHKFRVIISSRLGAVASAHQEKMTDGFVLDRFDHRAGNAHDRISGKPDHYGLALWYLP